MTPIAGFAAQGNVHMLQVESKGRLGTVKDFMQISYRLHQRVQDGLIIIWSGNDTHRWVCRTRKCTHATS
jgi:hypothetical protein